MQQVTPRRAALAAITVLQERLTILQANLDERAYVSIDNEYQRRVVQPEGSDLLAVECWDTHHEYDGSEPPPEPAPNAAVLAAYLLAAVCGDAVGELALQLQGMGYAQ
jgi:hypothetical protein